jgi:hypothetical protein
MIKYNETEFREVCERSLSMAKAAVELGIHMNTFRRIAKKLGCYKTNQSGKGMTKKNNKGIPLLDILEGNHKQYQTYKLKNKLIKENIKENKCENCGIFEWNKLPINCELDHIDGDSRNHKLDNLRILCPNCHSQTDTFRARNINRIINCGIA